MQFAGKNYKDPDSLFSAIANNWVTSNGAATPDDMKNRIINTSAEALTFEWMESNSNYNSYLIEWEMTEDHLRQGLVTAFRELIERTIL